MISTISASLLHSSLPRFSSATFPFCPSIREPNGILRFGSVSERGFGSFSSSRTPSKRRRHAFVSRNRYEIFPIHLSLREMPASGNRKTSTVPERGFRFVCFGNAPEKGSGLALPIFERWDAPWEWQTVVLTMIACGISFVLTGLVEVSVTSYLGLQSVNLSVDEKAEILFVDQFIVTAVVLGVVYGLTKSFQPLPDDIFCYNWKEPFNLQKGWFLWAIIGIVGALLAIALSGVALGLFNGETPEREKDALILLLPLIGSSSISTACLVGITGVLAPVLEETLFRGFLMVSLTKWLPTPVSVIISAAAFAVAHLTPGEFPQLFVLGTALGFSYAHTRNLLTPITIHALWNSGVILILTFLQLQGYDISKLLQGS